VLLGERLTSKWAHALFAATEPSNHEHRLRALRLEAEALAPLGEADLDRRLNAANVWQRELNAAPQGPFAAYCKNALWRLRHLVVGENAPDFSGIDVDGNEIQLDDFRDKVIVVGFFSFERTGDRQRAIQFHRLASQFESEPFALVGVNQDPQPNVFRKLWEEYELRFPCVFEGGRHGRVASAWHLDAPPKNLVIDRAGRLRYVDLDAAALEQAVAELISESASADKIPRTTNSRR
jgi:peroxiredoxin